MKTKELLLFIDNLYSGILIALSKIEAFYRTINEEIINMADDGNSTGSNFIWAVAMIIIVAIIAGALYYSGFLSGNRKQKIDVEVSAPSVTTTR